MEREIEELKRELEDYMQQYVTQNICLAFSGGVDSSLLLKVAADAAKKAGTKVFAVTFDSKLHPSCDLAIARRVSAELGGIHHIIRVDELEQEKIRSNPENRCYLCKKHLFYILREFAKEQGIEKIFDGTNEDDMHVYRPGLKALKELDIISPLAELHITKRQVKEISAQYGISVASRPSTPCMATRLPYHTHLDYDILERIEKGEEYLHRFINGNIRLRLHKDVVRMEVDREAMEYVIREKEPIISYLKSLGFLYITMDLEGFRSGSMDAFN